MTNANVSKSQYILSTSTQRYIHVLYLLFYLATQ